MQTQRIIYFEASWGSNLQFSPLLTNIKVEFPN